MEAQYGEVLAEVILRINTIIEKKHVVNREVLGAINTIAARICEDPPNSEQFTAFLKEAHDWFTKFDSPMRAMILRIMRLCSSSRAHCIAIIDEEMHWITTVCLEREQECLVERMQALKLIKKFIQHVGDAFPLAFARSLVAIANYKDDNIRRVCLETLRELSIENPRIVCTVNGLPTLIEAILEPSTAVRLLDEELAFSFGNGSPVSMKTSLP
jgi:rapamycin-insensitive companion of mTOR